MLNFKNIRTIICWLYTDNKNKMFFFSFFSLSLWRTCKMCFLVETDGGWETDFSQGKKKRSRRGTFTPIFKRCVHIIFKWNKDIKKKIVRSISFSYQCKNIRLSTVVVITLRQRNREGERVNTRQKHAAGDCHINIECFVCSVQMSAAERHLSPKFVSSSSTAVSFGVRATRMGKLGKMSSFSALVYQTHGNQKKTMHEAECPAMH